MRLDKFISNNTNISRSEVRKLTKLGRITLNQLPVTNAAININAEDDRVAVDGEAVQALGDLYYMLNKPKGYVCANSDGQLPTVIDLLRDETASRGGRLPHKNGALTQLQVVGRLDVDTTGLVLLTNDGDWNHRITSPRSNCFKCYQVVLDKAPPAHTQVLFAQGVLLEGEKKKTQPAYLEIITSKHVRLLITEGKFHQVKRMFATVGCRVKSLHRDAIGPIKLDEALQAGEFRELLAQEVLAFEKNPAINSEDLIGV